MERCRIDLCRWCGLCHRAFVPTSIRHQMLAWYLWCGLGDLNLCQHTRQNPGFNQFWHRTSSTLSPPVYRLALVVLPTSPPTLKWHHKLVYANITSRFVILFKLNLMLPVTINMLTGKSQLSITIVESNCDLFVAFMLEHLWWPVENVFEFYYSRW